MAVFRGIVALLASLLIFENAFGQDAGKLQKAEKSEDQMIAEAIWSLVDFGSGHPTDAQTAFNDASTAFPQSAKVSYWRGRFVASESNQKQVLLMFSSIFKTLSVPEPDDSKIAQPLQPKLLDARAYAKSIGELLEQRAYASKTTESFELWFLDAISHDETMVEAWAGLLDSPDITIALMAADAWANQEPDNAMPLYAKAVILTRGKKGTDDLLDLDLVNALELGNTKPYCRAPMEPWPVHFKLIFPNSEWAAKSAGKPVSPIMFRHFVEKFSLQTDAMRGGGTSISHWSLRDLGYMILDHSHRLSRQDDVRYLRAFAGVGLHLVNSNRFYYGILGGVSLDDYLLKRLETIAVDQGDFLHAQEFASIRTYMRDIGGKISAGYLSHPEYDRENGLIDIDLEASQIMEANKKSLSIPSIDLVDKTTSKFLISDETSHEANLVQLNLFGSNNDVFVCGRGQKFPDTSANPDEISQLGYITLSQAVRNLRESNLKERLRRGVFLVVDDQYLAKNVADICYTLGYLAKDDPCIIAFTNREHLEKFRENNPRIKLRVAQILGNGGILDHHNTDIASDLADMVVAPLARLIDANGQMSPIVRSSKLPFVAIDPQREQDGSADRLPGVDSLAGVVRLDFPIRSQSDDKK